MQFFQVLSPFRYKLSDNEKNNLRVMSIDYNPADKFVTYSWNNGSQGHMGVQLPFCNQLIQRNKKGGRSQRWRWMKRSDDESVLLSTSLTFIRSKPRKTSSSYWDRKQKERSRGVRALPSALGCLGATTATYRLGHHSPGFILPVSPQKNPLLELALLCGHCVLCNERKSMRRNGFFQK